MKSTAKWSQKRQPSWVRPFILPFIVALCSELHFNVFIFDCVACTPSRFCNLPGPCSSVPSDVGTTQGNSSAKRLKRAGCPCFCLQCEGKFDACLSARVIFHLPSAQLTDRRMSRTQTGTFTLSSSPTPICLNTVEALKLVLLVSAEHTLWIFCGIVLPLLKRQFCSLSYFPQVLRPGSRYEVSVTGVRTGNESGSITTEFTTGEAQQKTRAVVTVCVRDPCSALC